MDTLLRIGACLSLSGKFAQFGRQAAQGLEAWRSLDGHADILIEDDRSDRRTLEAVLPGIAARCDILLGPYSTQLMRAAGRMAAESGWLVWNHGGSGDDVEQARPGHVVSVLTPTSRYAEPFLVRLASEPRGPSGPSGPSGPRDLCIVHGPGSFGRQVADGAEVAARRLGIRPMRACPDGQMPLPGMSGEWDLFSAGVFEQDTEMVSKALRLPTPPRHVCAIAAGVREFGNAVDDPEGVFGIAQWFPGGKATAELGPSEDDFISAYVGTAATQPDYPAVQAAAAAIIATHCARLAGSTTRDDLWAAARDLDTSTFFGGFTIDPGSGAQVKHQTVLVGWTDGQPAPAGTLPEERSGHSVSGLQVQDETRGAARWPPVPPQVLPIRNLDSV